MENLVRQLLGNASFLTFYICNIKTKLFVDTTTSQTAEYAIIVLCKNSPSDWVFEKADKVLKLLLKASLGKGDQATAKQLINLIAVITKQFCPSTKSVLIKNIEVFFKCLIKGK